MEKNYNGFKLTPNIFAEILIELFDGKQFERKDALAMVQSYFVEHGGRLENKNYVQVFKAASKRLKDKGMINKGYGIWVINYREPDIEIISIPKEESFSYTVDKELGTGSQAVYVYFYDAYKKLANLVNKNIWECKIGRTEVDPIQRVLSQTGTCYPELPHLALIIHCDDSAKLEAALHSILKYKDRWLKNAPGNEWFLTSPFEIEELYNGLLEKGN